MASKAPAMGNL